MLCMSGNITSKGFSVSFIKMSFCGDFVNVVLTFKEETLRTRIYLQCITIGKTVFRLFSTKGLYINNSNACTLNVTSDYS